ncbi:MAG: hypothetical protein IKM85_05965 [Bacteroidales bacterium]|nr:hypothetical protein [Bacteroidales bacterium]
MRKRLKNILIIVSIIVITLLLVLFLLWICFFISDYLYEGKNRLGNNIYMVEDGKYRAVVYCTKHKGNTCYVGIPMIPQISSDDISVITAESINNWIIVEAYHHHDGNKQMCYFLIDKTFDIKDLDCKECNCDSILQSHITQFDHLQDIQMVLDH